MTWTLIVNDREIELNHSEGVMLNKLTTSTLPVFVEFTPSSLNQEIRIDSSTAWILTQN